MFSKEIILYHYSFSPYARRCVYTTICSFIHMPEALKYSANGSIRVVWYLNLREIPYLECVSSSRMLSSTFLLTTTSQKQPVTLPRPDLAGIGTNYRRIPILAIGRDVYNDTRLILRKLEELFPEAPSISCAEHKAFERLLESWATDGGIFNRASQLIHVDSPLMIDPKVRLMHILLCNIVWQKVRH